MNWKSFFIGVLLVASLQLLYQITFPSTIIEDNQIVKELKKKNQKLDSQNKLLEREVVGLKKESHHLLGQIEFSNNRLKKIKDELKKKNKSIDSMSIVELHEYFSKFKTLTSKDR